MPDRVYNQIVYHALQQNFIPVYDKALFLEWFADRDIASQTFQWRKKLFYAGHYVNGIHLHILFILDFGK